METEIWKDIPGYEGLYQVSNLGRVKSLERIEIGKRAPKYVNERILKEGTGNGNYLGVFLYKDKTRISFKTHVLVAISFLDHKPGRHTGIVVDHINNVSTDNRLINLQLISYSKNRSKDIIRDLPTGVTIDNSMINKYRARIRMNGKCVELGRFYTPEEAGQAYKVAYYLIHGDR